MERGYRFAGLFPFAPFFLSDLSSYITGQTVLVDGGLNLKWTQLGADNTSLFLKDESFRAAIKR